MLTAATVGVRGSRVLDLGAGTGAATRLALDMGAAQVIATDIAPNMLLALPFAAGIERVVADVAALPFRSGAFELVTAGCCLGHLAEPIRGLREAFRVGSAIVATAFTAGWTHPAKSVVDETLRDYGFVNPEWYSTLKRNTEPQVDSPEKLRALAVAAGWRRVDVTVQKVATGLLEPGELVEWRWGMAHIAPFVAGMPVQQRIAARAAAERAVGESGELVIPLVILSAQQ
jgi:ubiquinone/menaquinone biosynthesis C-methylase UbiE